MKNIAKWEKNEEMVVESNILHLRGMNYIVYFALSISIKDLIWFWLIKMLCLSVVYWKYLHILII